MKFLIAALLTINTAFAYTPTVESLFRHGSNPEVTTNALSLSFSVKDLGNAEIAQFYKVFFDVFDQQTLKVSQTTYNSDSFSEGSLLKKVYHSQLSAVNFKNQPVDKGLFYSLLHSIILNDGAFMVDYLKLSGVPVKHNSELLNDEKIALMKEYRNYLVAINNDRSLKKTLHSPLKPESDQGQERANRLMNEPMYKDTEQVKLSSYEGKPAWLAQATGFEAYFSYEERRPLKIRLKTSTGEIEIQCLDYWRPDAAHAIPKKMIIKTSKGEMFQVETLSLRYYNEKEDDLVKRLRHWDEILRTPKEVVLRPDFLF
jgi:hypothetical protein